MSAGKGKNRWLGVCQTGILRRLAGGEFVGTGAQLAQLVGHPERRTWYALSGLVERRLVSFSRSGAVLKLRATAAGRRVGGH